MVPWMLGPVEFTVPGGEASLVQLGVPPRGRIRNIRLFQTAGAAGDATVQLFQSEAAARSLLTGWASEPFDGPDPNVHSVFGAKTATAGTLDETDKAYDYQNRDGSLTTAKRRLWLVITPASGGDHTYTLSMLIADLLNL